MKIANKVFGLGVGLFLAGLMMGCESSTSSTTTGISISPASVYLTAGKISTVAMSASGGDSNYTWSVSSTNLGGIYGGGTTAVYVSTTNTGINTVLVTDDKNETGSAVITQQ